MLSFNAVFMEFMGSFIICYLGGYLISTHLNIEVIYLFQGVILGVLITIGVKISGGHYNPAITTALYSVNKIDTKTAIAYTISQLSGNS